ncbi:hypothetical protein ACU5AX_01475 [Sphingomonas sp. XXL09]|uniref:hypothetical protein n=1 Tax=Sphingomonas sp. XXL09 TaxID=3457787 RepID=UPI00406BA596
MGSKKFRTIHDWSRHGVNIHLTCINGPCSHVGIADPHACCLWFRAHRWPIALDAGAWRHFRCTKCGSKGAHLRPTDMVITVVDFFPVDERGWQALVRRLRS